MVLRKLHLLNFKNLEPCDLEFSEKVNCFLGDNGMGKTNLLDAIYHLAFCKSFTNPTDGQNICHDADFYLINGAFEGDLGMEEVVCSIRRRHRKVMRRNGKEYARLSEHIGLIPLVVVSPDDTLLVGGGSEERRSFLDMLISQLHPAYLAALIRYDKALKQRNAMLRQEIRSDGSLYEAIELQLEEYGGQIFRYRSELIEQLLSYFQSLHTQVCSGQDVVGLGYESHLSGAPLLEQLVASRERDHYLGYTTRGSHRDDLTMLIDGHPLRRIGSQGQIKSYVVALKLAQYRYLTDHGKTHPLLLLDDIFDKLDGRRVEQIIALLNDESFGQTFITDTNRAHLHSIVTRLHGDHRLFRVDRGVITPESYGSL